MAAFYLFRGSAGWPLHAVRQVWQGYWAPGLNRPRSTGESVDAAPVHGAQLPGSAGIIAADLIFGTAVLRLLSSRWRSTRLPPALRAGIALAIGAGTAGTAGTAMFRLGALRQLQAGPVLALTALNGRLGLGLLAWSRSWTWAF